MDGGERTQSQYGGAYQSSGGGRSGSGRPMVSASQDQYSQVSSSPSRPDMTTQSAQRAYIPSYQYGYQDPQFQAPQMQASQMPFNPSYVHDPSRAHHLQPLPNQQQYSPYGQGAMLPPMGQQSMYAAMPSYQDRQSTALEVMSGQFGGIPQYMPPAGSGGVDMGQSSSAFVSGQPGQQAYGSMAGRPQLQPPFAPSASAYQTLEQPAQMQSQEEADTQQAMEEGKRQYDLQLKATFEAISAGRVSEASEKVLAVTEWLLGSVRALGLHHDDERHHDQRILMWRELNHAWEALGQKQKTVTEEAIRTRRQPQDVLSVPAITNLIDKLIQLCDQVEKYGLVDYELGIWEEQIVSIFTQCLDLLQQEQR